MRAIAAARKPDAAAAALQPSPEPLGPPPRTREARLAAWAAALERCGELAQLRELDGVGREACRALRKDGSAASVAFADPRLRAAGLRGDSVAALCEFFELSPEECHRVLCECGACRVQTGARAAATVRRLARRARLERARARLCAAIVAGLGVLLGLRLLVA